MARKHKEECDFERRIRIAVDQIDHKIKKAKGESASYIKAIKRNPESAEDLTLFAFYLKKYQTVVEELTSIRNLLKPKTD